MIRYTHFKTPDDDVEMKHSRNRYQHGSIREVPRANGFAWEFRFYCSDGNGERKLKTQTFDALKYPTETAVRKDAHAKDLMRHSDIKTTMNVYGKAVSKEMRDGNARVVKQLL